MFNLWIRGLEPKSYGKRFFFLVSKNLFTDSGPDLVPLMFYSDFIEHPSLSFCHECLPVPYRLPTSLVVLPRGVPVSTLDSLFYLSPSWPNIGCLILFTGTQARQHLCSNLFNYLSSLLCLGNLLRFIEHIYLLVGRSSTINWRVRRGSIHTRITERRFLVSYFFPLVPCKSPL